MNKINLNSAATLREPAELVAHGLVPAADLPDLEKIAARYAVAVTTDIAALIDPDDPDDPIARQFIPGAEELVTQASENPDPIGDHAHSLVVDDPGVSAGAGDNNLRPMILGQILDLVVVDQAVRVN